MLVYVSNAMGTPEDVTMDVALQTHDRNADQNSSWVGHPLRVRGVLRDGTEVSIGLNMTECVHTYLQLHLDFNVRQWADITRSRVDDLG